MSSGSAPLRVVHVTAPAPAGGLESVIQSLVPAQAERGQRVTVVAVVVPGDVAADRLFAPLRVLPVRLEALELPARAYLGELRGLARIIRDAGADVVHTHGYRSDVTGGTAARLLGRPRVSTIHGFIGGTSRGRLYEAVQRRMLRAFDAVVAVSSPLVAELRAVGIAPERIHRIPNALGGDAPTLEREEARASLRLEAGPRHVGWVGRLGLEKGPDVAVEAVAALARSDVVLSFVGDGPMRGELETLARERGIQERVRFHGLIEGAGRLMPAFDALLLSSRTEGTPMVLLEAMAAGVPIVATRVGGVPDVVEGVGRLVEPCQPEALAHALGQVLDADRDALGRAGRRRVAERFAPGPWAEAYDRVYRGVVRPGRGTEARR